jgi:hypothetical protein
MPNGTEETDRISSGTLSSVTGGDGGPIPGGTTPPAPPVPYREWLTTANGKTYISTSTDIPGLGGLQKYPNPLTPEEVNKWYAAQPPGR